MKNQIVLGFLAMATTATAFGSGSPAVTCYDKTQGSKLAVYISFDRAEEVAVPTYYEAKYRVAVEEVTKQSNSKWPKVEELGEMGQADENAAFGKYVFQNKEGKAVPQKLKVNFKSAEGSVLNIVASGEEKGDMTGRMTLIIREKDTEENKKLNALEDVRDAKVKCAYSWD